MMFKKFFHAFSLWKNYGKSPKNQASEEKSET